MAEESGLRPPRDLIGCGSCPVIRPVLVPGACSRFAHGDFRFSVAGAPGTRKTVFFCSTNLHDWRVLAALEMTNTTLLLTPTNAAAEATSPQPFGTGTITWPAAGGSAPATQFPVGRPEFNLTAAGGSATVRNTPNVALTADNVYV